MTNIRIGIGYDVHPFAENRKLILGGVDIEFSRGLQGHSDADVLTHALIDALLGAASLPDIGTMFPDSDGRYKNISSILLLGDVFRELDRRNIAIVNIDAVIVCESPRISPYADAMKKNISAALGGLPASRIGIKGKTSEGLGFTGRQEGIAAHAVSLVELPI